MSRVCYLLAATLIGCLTLSAAGGAYARGHGSGGGHGAGGHGNGPGVQPHNQMRQIDARTAQGMVSAVTASGWTLTLPHTLPITVVVSATTTFAAGGVSLTQTMVQPGIYVRVHGTLDPTTHALDADKVTILLTTVLGTVTAVDGNTLTVQSRRGATVTITTTADTRWQATGRLRHPGIQSTGPISGTSTISSTTTISGTTAISGTTVPSTVPPVPQVVVNDRVTAEGIPGSDGHSLTAIIVVVRPAAKTTGDDGSDGSDG